MQFGKIHFLILLACAGALMNGCAGRGDKQVLATINRKDKITVRDFNEIISKLPPRYQENIARNRKEFLDELIVDRLLYNEGIRKELDRDKDVQKLFNEAKRKIVMARLLQDEVEESATVSEKEIEDYYNANQEKFTKPETLRASHILVRTEKDASDILAELSNGRNFEDLARSHSIDPTAEAGGDIGYFTRGQLLPEFEEVCFGMKAGEISCIVKTKFGYHIIKLTERNEPEIKALREVRDIIEESLIRIKKKVLFNEFVTKLKKRAEITVDNGLLERICPKDKPGN